MLKKYSFQNKNQKHGLTKKTMEIQQENKTIKSRTEMKKIIFVRAELIDGT